MPVPGTDAQFVCDWSQVTLEATDALNSVSPANLSVVSCRPLNTASSPAYVAGSGGLIESSKPTHWAPLKRPLAIVSGAPGVTTTQ